MTTNILIQLIIGFSVCAIGAMPFGLVNLSVANATLKSGHKTALLIAFGASFVELIYGLSAITSGVFLSSYILSHPIINQVFTVIILLLSVLFFIKKEKKGSPKKYSNSKGFIQGVFLNFMSIQVLLFWLIAVGILSANKLLPKAPLDISLFLVGLFFGKIAVLRFYMFLSKKLISKSVILSSNINKIIGLILFFAAIFQFIKS